MDARPPKIDGLANFFHLTVAASGTYTTLERGINPIRAVRTSEGPRIPAILIRSSPHRLGTTSTPWQDNFDPDNGHVRYWGDAKVTSTVRPELTPGNRALLAELERHQSRDPDQRRMATPVLLFLAVPHQGRAKGNIRFQGAAVIQRAELRSQWDPATGSSFANYVYDFVVLDLSRDGESVDWSWIDRRRQPELTVADTTSVAPHAWRHYMSQGLDSLPALQRRVAKLSIIKKADQLPVSIQARRLLEAVYHFYRPRRHRFEALAELVAEHILGEGFRRGWITPPSADGGTDFVGRLDVGVGFATTRLVVLGQAKCEALDTPTGGGHIARTAARLRRGWLGVYVTTSHYSEAVQREVIQDRYPLALVNGGQLVATLEQLMNRHGMRDVAAFLNHVDTTYSTRIAYRDPEEILLES